MIDDGIRTGQLWKVTTDNFWTTGKVGQLKRPVKLTKGEIIQIRQTFEWHIRTQDDFYFHATPETILENSELYGEVWPNVRFKNVAELSDILRLKLYDRIGGNK